MFSSVCARLTLWYTGVLALVLIFFAIAGYFFLSYTLNRRTDDALGEMANAFAATLASEESDSHQGEDNVADAARGEEAKSSSDEAVKEAVSQNQFRDYRIAIYSAAGREVAASSLRQNRNEPGRMRPPPASQISGVIEEVARTSNSAPYFTTLSDGDNEYRVVARRVQARGTPYTLVALRSLHDQEDLLERAG